MARTNYNDLLDAGVHFGHLKRKWNPNMAPYIFMERSGIHIIDLNKTIAKIDEAAAAIKQIAKSGKKILFVATKKQAKDTVAQLVEQVNMPYVTERWPGGMLTNFATIRKAVKKMATIDRMETDGTFGNMSKRERLQILRERAKLDKQLGSIADLNRLPAAIFIVDICKEHIAVAEAKKLNIPTFAIVDTNANPNKVDYPIPANDDASKSIQIIVKLMIEAIQEGLAERKLEKDKALEEEEERELEEEARQRAYELEAVDAEDEDAGKAKPKSARKTKSEEADDARPAKGIGVKKTPGKRPRK
jgi:small subunit ribosomal protein S2